MSVPKPDRSKPDGLMELQRMAYKLYGYTAHLTSNEKIVPKRLRWCTGRFLVNAASAICRYIDLANSLRNDDIVTAAERLKCQQLARGSTFNLITEIHKAYYSHGFSDDVVGNWIEQVVAIQTKLDNWIKSDQNRAKREKP
jgi:hypothetical protein